MAIYVDVITKLEERSATVAAQRIEKQFSEAGKQAGEKFSEGASSEIEKAAERATSKVGSKTVPQYAEHGRDAGRNFSSAFEASVTALNERAVDAAANRLVSKFSATGKVSGEAFTKALEAEATRTGLAVDSIHKSLEKRLGLSSALADAGTKAGKAAGENAAKAIVQQSNSFDIAGAAIGNAFSQSLDRTAWAMTARAVSGFTRGGKEAARNFGGAFGGQMVRSLPGVSGFMAATSGYESAAGKVGAVAGRAMGMAFTVGAAGLIGVAGYTLFKGFERYKTIDAAKNRLENLNRVLEKTGKATIDVGRVMDTVNEVVTDTRFSLSDAFAVSTVALSSPTGDLKRFMTVVADTAQFTGQSISDVGEAFLQVANSGKVGLEILNNQLSRIPKDWLAEQLGVDLPALNKMLSKGQVGLEDLMAAMEKNVGGFAKGGVNTIEGAIEQMHTAVARLGANVLGALFGQPTDDANDLAKAINKISERLNDVNKWVVAHQGTIKRYFDMFTDAVKWLAEALGWVMARLNDIPGGVKIAAAAFIGWKTISGVSSLIANLTTINTMLHTTLPRSAATGAARIAAELSKVAIPLWLTTLIEEKYPNFPFQDQPDGETRIFPGWVPILPFWEDRIRDWFGDDGMSGPTDPNGNFYKDWYPRAGVQGPGDPGAPGGSPILDPSGAGGGGSGGGSKTALPYPAEYGQPPLPGETNEQWRARMQRIEAEHDRDEKRAQLAELEASGAGEADLIKARNAVTDAEMRLIELGEQQRKQRLNAPTIPLPAEYGQGLLPGESPEQWRTRMEQIRLNHDVEQKRANLNALMADNTATQDEIIAARNELTEAEIKAYEAANAKLKGLTSELGEIGAALDADFGISKGLAGIAENITKFVANLAAAPMLGKLSAISANSPSQGGHGLMGILGAQGVFGPRFTGIDPSNAPYAGSGLSPSAPSAIGPAALQPPTAAGSVTALPTKEQVKEIAKQFGLQVTSETRPGDRGYHGQGLAMDISNSSGPTPQMRAFAEYMSSNFGPMLKELIYDEPGWTGNVKDGQRTGAFGNVYTMGQAGYHGDHVHVAGDWGESAAAVPQVPATGSAQPYTGTGSLSSGGFPIPLPVTIVGGAGVNSITGAVNGLSNSVAGAAGANWEKLAQFESGGNWQANTGNGYFGGLQFKQSTWDSFKPAGAPERADLASKDQQIAAAEATLRAQGPTAWPAAYAQNPQWFQSAPAGTPASGVGAGPLPGPGGAGTGTGAGFPGLGGPPQSLNTARIGGVEPASGTGSGGVGMSSGGALDMAMQAGGMALDVMAPGAGQVAQTGIKLANRAIEFGGQAIGIGVQGALDTVIPWGGSELASNNWLTKIVGGIAGAAPALPNTAGKSSQAAAEPPLDASQAAQAQSSDSGGQQAAPVYNTTINNSRDTGDGLMRDFEYHTQLRHSAPGM